MQSVIELNKSQRHTIAQQKYRKNSHLKDPFGYDKKLKADNRRRYLKYQVRYKKKSLEYYHVNRDAINEKRRKK